MNSIFITHYPIKRPFSEQQFYRRSRLRSECERLLVEEFGEGITDLRELSNKARSTCDDQQKVPDIHIFIMLYSDAVFFLFDLMSVYWEFDRWFEVFDETEEGKLPNPIAYFNWSNRTKAWEEKDNEKFRLITCLEMEISKGWDPAKEFDLAASRPAESKIEEAEQEFTQFRNKLRNDLIKTEDMEIKRYKCFLQLTSMVDEALKTTGWVMRWEEEEEPLERCYFQVLSTAVRLNQHLSRRFSKFEELFNSIRDKAGTPENLRDTWSAVREQCEAPPSSAAIPISDKDERIEAAAPLEDIEEEQDGTHEQEQEEFCEEAKGEPRRGAQEESRPEIMGAGDYAIWKSHTSLATGRDEPESYVHCQSTLIRTRHSNSID